MPTKLDINDISRLHNIFQNKRWFDNVNQNTVHKNFCELLNNLSKEQRDLIHELSENYLWVTTAEYSKRFNELLDRIPDNVLSKCSAIYLFPIVKPKDEKKIKSAPHCIYYFKGLFSLNNR